MDLHQLQLFRDLALELSFVKAARLNHITQPAVSFQIKKLEEQLGLKLFERVPRRVALTNEGRLLLPHVEEILKSCNNLKTFSGEVMQLPSGEVTIASIHSIGMYELGASLRRFLSVYPRIHVRLKYIQASEIYDLVQKKKVDLGIVAFPEAVPLINSVPFGTDKLVLAVPPGHRFATKLSVKLEQLEGERFIAFDEGIPTREAIDNILRQAKVSVDIRMTNDNIYAIKSAVQAKLGIAFVPDSTIAEEVRHGVLCAVNVRGADLKRPRAIITHSKRQLSRPAEMFLRSIASGQ